MIMAFLQRLLEKRVFSDFGPQKTYSPRDNLCQTATVVCVVFVSAHMYTQMCHLPGD